MAVALVALALIALTLHSLAKTPNSPSITNASSSTNEAAPQTSVITTSPQPAKSLPERLLIPKIRVDAAIQHLGLTKSGAMDVPTNNMDVGWFKLGSIPGAAGSAVIAGHRGPGGVGGIFQKLQNLAIGDKVYVKDRLGVVTTFVVWQTKTYEPDAEPPEVFSVSDGVHLNLITCTGTWSFGQQSYGKRLVVFTSVEKSSAN